jgi:hypothetical protein
MGWSGKVHCVACTGEMMCYSGDGLVGVAGGKLDW